MRYPILAALLDEADRIRLAAATETTGRDLLSESTPLPVFVIAENAARLPDLMRSMDAARLPREVIHLTDAQATDLIRRFDASNNPVDAPLVLPPRPEWTQAIQAFEPAAKVWPQPQPKPQRKPPPCAGHSRLGRPFRIGGESRRPGTADANKRAKRKAAEKSRRRNRR